MADLVIVLSADRFPRIFNALTEHLPIRDIIALTRTCRTLNPLYQKMMNNTAWDINTRLEKFVKDPIAFRQRLAELDGIISGGFALQFMDRVNWKGSDLDICVQVGDKADAFCHYMEEVEGYDLASRKAGSYQWTHVDMVHQYDKEVNGELVRLEIILTINHPIHSTLSTYTTALTNVITGSHAYSIFPNATFIKRRTYPTRIPDYFNTIILGQKYMERGWYVDHRMPKEKMTTEELDVGFRRIGDKHTWKMALSSISDEPVDQAEGAVDGLHFEIKRCVDLGDDLKWLGVAATQAEKHTTQRNDPTAL